MSGADISLELENLRARAAVAAQPHIDNFHEAMREAQAAVDGLQAEGLWVNIFWPINRTNPSETTILVGASIEVNRRNAGGRA